MFRVFGLTVALLGCLLIASMLQGCGDSGTAKVAGTYELDKTAMKAAMQAEIDGIEDDMEKMGAAMMLGMIDMMSITITLNEDGSANGLMVMGGDEDPATGSWTLNGKAISITLAPEGDSNPETMSGTFDGDTIRLDAPEEEEMPFQMVFTRKAA